MSLFHRGGCLACFLTEEAVFEAACEGRGTLSLIQESNSEHLITTGFSFCFDGTIRVGRLASVAVAAGTSLSSISGNDNNCVTTTGTGVSLCLRLPLFVLCWFCTSWRLTLCARWVRFLGGDMDRVDCALWVGWCWQGLLTVILWVVKGWVSIYDFTRYQHCTKKIEHCTYLKKTMIERVSGGQSGLKVIVTVTLTGLNAGYLVGKIVPFESRFHKIPALYKENSTLHIPQ